MEFKGKVIWIGEKRQGTSSKGSAWSRQEYAIQDAMQRYPKTVAFSVFGEDKINEFNIRMGEEIKIYFDIDARQYEGRFFNDVQAWKVERPNAGQSIAPQPQPSAFSDPFPSAQPAPVQSAPQQGNDGLPF